MHGNLPSKGSKKPKMKGYKSSGSGFGKPAGKVGGGKLSESMRRRDVHGKAKVSARNTVGGVAKPSSGHPTPKKRPKNTKGIGRMMTSGY